MRPGKTLMGIGIVCHLALTAQPGVAHAREKAGNGGAGYACTDGKVFLLDTIEGTEFHKFSIVLTDQPVVNQIDGAVQKLAFANDIRAYVSETAHELLRSHDLIEGRASLPLIEDAFPEIELEGCKRAQIASYGVDNRLRIMKRYYDALTRTEQAALYVHEAVYKLFRMSLGSQDSKMARKLTALLFSESPSAAGIQSVVREATQGRPLFLPQEPVYVAIHSPYPRCEFMRSIIYFLPRDKETPPEYSPTEDEVAYNGVEQHYRGEVKSWMISPRASELRDKKIMIVTECYNKQPLTGTELARPGKIQLLQDGRPALLGEKAEYNNRMPPEIFLGYSNQTTWLRFFD